MTTTTVHSESPAEPSIFERRRTARRRAWACPGAGFGLFGYSQAAAVTYLTGAATFLAAIWTAWTPSRAALYITLLLFAVSTVAWIVELWTVGVLWPRRPAGPWAERYRAGVGLIVALAAALVVVVLSTYGTVREEGPGMQPTVKQGEVLLYRTTPPGEQLAVGRLVLFKLAPESKFGEPGKLMLGRILAGPGDTMSIRNGRYYVNDVAGVLVSPTGDKAVSLEITAHPGKMPLQDGQYFVVQDSIDESLDSRVFHWARRENIVSAQFWSLMWPRWFSPIK